MRSLILAVAAVAALSLMGCSYPLQKTNYLPPSLAFDAVNTNSMQVGTAEKPDLTVDPYFLTKTEMRELADDGQPMPDPAALGLDMTNVQPTLFVVAEPQWLASPGDLDDKEREDILFTVRERLYRYLLREYPHPVRVRYSLVPDDPLVEGYRVLTLKTAVTHVKTGWGPARYFLGYGAGGTSLQLEGQFFEPQDDAHPVAWFRVREDHGGYPMGFMNPRVFSATYCLKYATDKVIKKYTQDMRSTVPGFRPRPTGIVPIPPDIDQKLSAAAHPHH